MSKAFTREEDVPDPMVQRRPASALPPGAKNYLTREGALRLRRDLEHLLQVERPQAAAGSDPGVAREQLQVLDHRIDHLQDCLASAVIVDPPSGPPDRVRFGATVTVREGSGDEVTYRIVGVDETDLDRNWVSWLSPIAKALLNTRLGDQVRFKLGASERLLEIVSICFE